MQARILLVFVGVVASPLGAQSVDSLVTDSTTQPTAPLAPGLSAPARSIGSVRHTVDSIDIGHGARPRTLSELLQARLPGVSVLRYGGDPSDGSRIRIRGTVSLVGDAAPVVVIDGIPINTPERLGRSTSLTPSSRFDDFEPEEIERVDVLPGPAATTLFGAGASNGAIVITTKRGASGPARWNAWSQGAMTSEPTTYPANYRQNGTNPVTGAAAASCSVLDIAAGRCTPTTLDVWNPLESASPFRQGRYAAGGASVAGGPFGIRAFASAIARTETSVLDDSEGSRINGRLNAERELFDGFLVGGNVGYVKRDATLRMDHVVQRGLAGTAVDDANRGYRPAIPVPPGDRVGDRLSRSARVDWRVRSWLRVNALVGRDELTQRDFRRSLDFRGEEWELNARSWQGSSLVHGTVATTHRVARLVGLQTLLSYDEAKRRSADEETSITPADGTVWSEERRWTRSSIRSWMLQERIDLGGELFVNLGARRVARERSDGPGWHPSVDAAWNVGRVAGGATLRLRGAYAVGVPPRDTAVPVFFVPGWPLDPAASPPIEPEQPREAEIGIDASWGSRLELSATYFDQHTPKLITFALGSPSGGGGAGMRVVPANMENRGIEIGARIRLVDDPTTRWTASTTLATLRNRASEIAGPPWLGGPGVFEGEPFGTVNGVPYTFIDANGDGLPVQSEIAFSGVTAAGTVIPTREASLRSELGVRRWGLTLAAALDHRGGHRAYDMARRYTCGFRRCPAWQDPAAPLDDKVLAIAALDGSGSAYYLGGASYTRLGELALAWTVPARFGRVFGNGFTLIVEGRNLATWTKFTGPDPEVATSTAAWQSVPMLPAVPRTVGVRVEWR